MTAIARPRTFQGGGHIELMASTEKGGGILLPCLLVKIYRQKPACLVWQKRISADGEFARQMLANHLIG